VALARALAVKPKLFLMDEPLSNLDAKLRVVMRTELKAIHQRTGATSIFVTHDQSEAMSMADRIVIMKDGEIVQVGTPDDVYFRSADMFVAGFIGTPPTNFFPVTLISDGKNTQLIHSRFRLTAGADDAERLKNSGEKSLILGVRPEDIRVVGEKESLMSVEVMVVEPQGSFQIVAVEIEKEVVKLLVSSEKKIFPGDSLHLSFNPDRLHFFNCDTEKRI
jgi:multiple sugar transport system ATP-binding protein